MMIFTFITLSIFLLFQFVQSKNAPTNIAVFRATENPAAIVRGTHGSALTIDISFGDEEISEWIENLQKPYPLLFLDIQWIERFPEIVQLIDKKKIPTGLLGSGGNLYKTDDQLLSTQIQTYTTLLGEKPIWFRTDDNVFPDSLQAQLWNEQINALSASFTWVGGEIPPMTEGEIIAIPHHLHERIQLEALQRLMENRDFKSIDEVLFGPIDRLKKIPN